jgi:predicted nucleic acid-binding protein
LSLFVDTSVWSLAFRRDKPPEIPEIQALRRAIRDGEPVLTTGLVLQELLQGFAGPRFGLQIIERFAALPVLVPNRDDHIEAAALRNKCRRGGIQIGTVEALLAQLCIHHDLIMLATDGDFRHMASHCELKVWHS